MTELTTAWMLGCVCGFFMGVTVAGSVRRSTCRELMRDRGPREPTFAELLMPSERRPGPTTSKPDIIPRPQPPLGRIIDASGRTIGYQPLPWVQGPANPPPRNP